MHLWARRWKHGAVPVIAALPQPLVFIFWLWLFASVGVYVIRLYRRIGRPKGVEPTEVNPSAEPPLPSTEELRAAGLPSTLVDPVTPSTMASALSPPSTDRAEPSEAAAPTIPIIPTTSATANVDGGRGGVIVSNPVSRPTSST